MFVLEDGRKNLFQWDVDRRLIVEDPTITEVHFCNKSDDCSLVVETYTDNDTVYADIPNVLLQDRWDIRAYAYCGSGYTKVEEVFEVKARTKPTDYVYTETEIKRYEDLEKHLDERLDEIVKDGIKADLEGYATEAYVDEAVQNVQVDLTGYATEGYVDNAIKNIDIPEPEKVDLTGYATESYVNKTVEAAKPDLNAYATRTELNRVSNSVPTKVSQLSNDAGYINKHQDISHLATIGQVQKVEDKLPTKTSQLTDDRGFLTKHQDISHLAPLSHTHPSYALKTEIPSTEGLATETYVDEAIAAIELPESEKIDLTGYAKEQWVKDQGYLTEHQDLSAYATHTELSAVSKSIPTKVSQLSNDKGYLTAHQDISYLATKGEVQKVEDKIPTRTSQLTNDKGFLTEHQDISHLAPLSHTHPSYATTESLNSYALKTYVDEAVANIDLPEGGGDSQFVYYVGTDPQKLRDIIAAKKIPIARVNLGNGNYHNYIYSHEEDGWFWFYSIAADKARIFKLKSTDGSTSEDYTSYRIPLGGSGSADLTDYYTKAETDELIGNINECDTYFFDPRVLIFDQGFNNQYALLSDSMAEFATRFTAGEQVALVIFDETLERYVPSEIALGDGSITVLRCLSVADTDRTHVVKQWRFLHSESHGGWVVAMDEERLFSLTTRSYVDTAIQNALSGIAQAEGGAY